MALKTLLAETTVLQDGKCLIQHIIGHNGFALLADRKNRLLEPELVTILRKWLAKTNIAQTLWIQGPSELGKDSSVKGSGLALITAALQAETPFISHFYELPDRGNSMIRENSQRTGLIGMLYNLIYQLLQFIMEETTVNSISTRLKDLDGSEASWPKAISLFEELLCDNSNLSYCVIHGINRLEAAGGSGWCSELISTLLKRQKIAKTPFSLLFTTSGSSRALSAQIQVQDRHIHLQGMKTLHKRGKLLELSIPQKTSE